MYDAILLPTDGSDAVEAALEQATRLASDYDATLYALYVVDQRVVRANDAIDDVAAELHDRGSEAVERVAERANDVGVDAETTLREGTPHKEIVAYATETDTDLIVMGPHGTEPHEKARGLGSVSDRVAADAEASVLLAKGKANDPSEEAQSVE